MSLKIAKAKLNKENKSGGITIPGFKMFYTAVLHPSCSTKTHMKINRVETQNMNSTHLNPTNLFLQANVN